MALFNSISSLGAKFFFKLKHLFLLSLHLVDNYVKNVDELGSEHHVRNITLTSLLVSNIFPIHFLLHQKIAQYFGMMLVLQKIITSVIERFQIILQP